MSALDCEQLLDVAPEFALEGLSGDERAAVIDHLERCSSCQDLVSSLAVVSDRLVLMAPQAQPPPGFEARVVEALVAPSPAVPPVATQPRRRAGVSALVVAASLALAVLGFNVDRSSPAALSKADMRSASGDIVGQVFLQRETPMALFMSLPGWSEEIGGEGWQADSYSVRVGRDDGSIEVLPVAADDVDVWVLTLEAGGEPVTSVAVVDAYGYVWCHAEFDPTVRGLRARSPAPAGSGPGGSLTE